MANNINILALVKGNERYIFLYDDKSKAETLCMLGRFASNPDLSFTWHDAAVLSHRIRKFQIVNNEGDKGVKIWEEIIRPFL
jgi:hypothetical protein